MVIPYYTSRKTKVVDNEDFGDFLDFAVEAILLAPIQTIRLGDNYQYLKYTGKIKAYLSKRKNRNNKVLVLKGVGFELECSLHAWDMITIVPRLIRIESIGLDICFQKSILPEYKKWVKENDKNKNN